MAEDEFPITIANPVLRKWRAHAELSKSSHDLAANHYKKKSERALVVTVFLGSTIGLMNIVLGALGAQTQSKLRAQAMVFLAQIVLGAFGLLSTAIASLSQQLGWPQKHKQHEQYSARYGEVVRMINTQQTLFDLNESTYCSEGEFIKQLQAELDRIAEHAPSIPPVISQLPTRV